MPAFHAQVPHALGQVEATSRLKTLVESVQRRYADQISATDGGWVNNILTFSMSTNGLTITGTLTVEHDSARVEGQLPLLAAPFKGMIERSIAGEIAQKLA